MTNDCAMGRYGVNFHVDNDAVLNNNNSYRYSQLSVFIHEIIASLT